jgi:hypothetical protein
MSTPLYTMDRPSYGPHPTAGPGGVDTTVLRPRRSPARVVLGLLTAALLALVFVWISQRADEKTPVLAVTRAVAVGQQLAAADLVAVRVAVEPGVPVVPASQLDQVAGHTAAVPLVRGALLAPRQIGAPAWPGLGQAEIALAVKAGHAPAGLQPGATVMVLITPTAGPAGTGGGQSSDAVGVQAPATLVAVDRASDGSATVTVSLLVGRSDGMRLAGTAGDVSLVLLAPRN